MPTDVKVGGHRTVENLILLAGEKSSHIEVQIGITMDEHVDSYPDCRLSSAIQVSYLLTLGELFQPLHHINLYIGT